MKRFEIDVFGCDKLVARLFAEILNVVHEERIGKWLPDEKDDLCTALCKPSDYFSAYSSSSALFATSATPRSYLLHTATHRDHDDFGMHVPFRTVRGAIEEPFQQVQYSKDWGNFHYGPAEGN